MSKTAKFSWSNLRARNGSLAALSLLLAYVSASIAIDRGSPWMYLLTITFCYLSVHYLANLIGAVRRGRKAK
jgi:xanthine/uracil/vitamin C permease (AzgA family)